VKETTFTWGFKGPWLVETGGELVGRSRGGATKGLVEKGPWGIEDTVRQQFSMANHDGQVEAMAATPDLGKGKRGENRQI